MERIFWLTPNGVLTACTEWATDVETVQYMETIVRAETRDPGFNFQWLPAFHFNSSPSPQNNKPSCHLIGTLFKAMGTQQVS